MATSPRQRRPFSMEFDIHTIKHLGLDLLANVEQVHKGIYRSLRRTQGTQGLNRAHSAVPPQGTESLAMWNYPVN